MTNDGPKMVTRLPQGDPRIGVSCKQSANFEKSTMPSQISSPKGPRVAQSGPRTAQDGPRRAKMVPRWPKMAQDGPKMAPRWSQDGAKTEPRRQQNGPRARSTKRRAKIICLTCRNHQNLLYCNRPVSVHGRSPPLTPPTLRDRVGTRNH